MNFLRFLFGKKQQELGNNSCTPMTMSPAWDLSQTFTRDYVAAHTYAKKNCREWEYYVPTFGFVPCASGHKKPAFFLKVGDDYQFWSQSTELKAIAWNSVATPNYSMLRGTLYFEDAAGAFIGVGHKTITIATTTTALHRLACSVFFDPADAENETLLDTWVNMPGVTAIFFVMNNCDNMNFVYYNIAYKAKATASLHQAQVQLTNMKGKTGRFKEECATLSLKIPYVERW